MMARINTGYLSPASTPHILFLIVKKQDLSSITHQNTPCSSTSPGILFISGHLIKLALSLHQKLNLLYTAQTNIMENHPRFPDLTDAERKVLEDLMPDEVSEIITSGMKRRHFLKLITFTGTGLLAAHLLGIEQLMARAIVAPPAPAVGIENGVNISFKVNGSTKKLLVDSRMTLLDTLRERLELTGSKKGCDHGQCGACTVMVDGRRVLSCLTLAATCEDKEVTTIEGLANGTDLHPMQAAFIKHDGFQCGYCTPGQICLAVALINEAKNGEASYVTNTIRQTGKDVKLSSEEIRERMSGNICRCGAYPNIVDAIREVHGDKAVAQVWQFADGTI